MLERIVSGGQTGADRAALEAAAAAGLAAGGWVPRGRLAEDGVVPDRYPGLVEAPSAEYAVRTRLNVRDSDATVVLSHGPVGGGTALTLELASKLGRPVLHLDLAALGRAEAAVRLRGWLAAESPRVLNVAGPRASEDPAIFEATREVLLRALSATPRAEGDSD